VRSLSCEDNTDRSAHPTHLGAKGTSVFGIFALDITLQPHTLCDTTYLQCSQVALCIAVAHPVVVQRVHPAQATPNTYICRGWVNSTGCARGLVAQQSRL